MQLRNEGLIVFCLLVTSLLSGFIQDKLTKSLVPIGTAQSSITIGSNGSKGVVNPLHNRDIECVAPKVMHQQGLVL